MDYQLAGKLALVTGSTKGIGRAAIEQLHQEGATVIIHGRSLSQASELASALGKNAHAVATDLSHQEGVDSLIAQVKKIGAPDILINNAGIYEPKEFFDIPDSEWLRFFEINVLSGVRLSRAFLPGMLQRNWGRIIFISSESAVNPPVEMIHYGMTKTAQLSISRGLSELTKGTNVTVNAILPGPTMSEGVSQFVDQMSEKSGKSRKEFKEQEFINSIRPTSLLQRFASSEEVAHMITYIASPLSVATNGASLRVDGGVIKFII
ncbi:MAG: SDR family oxidoreductase [Verrucomicrobia bacterium]|nr:SDR family oxidoreductase [Verrucomicrobiota bacterium]